MPLLPGIADARATIIAVPHKDKVMIHYLLLGTEYQQVESGCHLSLESSVQTDVSLVVNIDFVTGPI